MLLLSITMSPAPGDLAKLLVPVLMLPVTLKLLLTVVVPVLAPMFNVVAAPAKFIVDAVVLTSGNVVWLVVRPPLAFTANVPVVVIAPLLKLVSVPTLVRLLAVTPLANVSPLNVPAAAVTVIAALPSKLTPLIARAVANLVAVAALPDAVIAFHGVRTQIVLLVSVSVYDDPPVDVTLVLRFNVQLS